MLEDIGELKRSVRLIGKAMPGHGADNGSIYAELVGQGLDPDIADSVVSMTTRRAAIRRRPNCAIRDAGTWQRR